MQLHQQNGDAFIDFLFFDALGVLNTVGSDVDLGAGSSAG